MAFEIIVTGPKVGPGVNEWRAEADSAEGAMLAAQTGYDEVYDASITGREARRAMRVVVTLDGDHVATICDGRPR